mmetsp:Transcript_67166/g.189977  ORF Transcript_67166/g.189977 Transcript_67166/m.189977 type:complete len:202 (+) Transcript_67166:37-642(+)
MPPKAAALPAAAPAAAAAAATADVKVCGREVVDKEDAREPWWLETTSRPTEAILLHAVRYSACRRRSSSRGNTMGEAGEPSLPLPPLLDGRRGGEAETVAKTTSLALFCKNILVFGFSGAPPSPFIKSNIIGVVRNCLPNIFVAGVRPNFICKTLSFLYILMASIELSKAPKLAYTQSGSKMFITSTLSCSNNLATNSSPV